MTRTAADLSYDASGTYVLLRYPSGEATLWVEKPDASYSAYTLNDTNTACDLEPTEDIDAILEEWKHNVGWYDGLDAIY